MFFTTIILRPIFNLLVFVYAIIPGHNFGLAVIVFTVLVRLLFWPLVKKQLHQTKVMRKLQPEMKRIKAATKGDRQKESQMTMELYKERGVNPLGSLIVLIPQFIVLIGLYNGLRRVVDNPHELISFSYPFVQHLSWMQHIAGNIHQFDDTLFGVVNLTRSAYSAGTIYWPAMVLVIGSAIIQFYQSKQLLPTTKDSKGLRAVLREASEGKKADQTELNAAIGRSTRYLFPAVIFLVTVHYPAALGLYWLVGGLVAYIQQSVVLREDTEEMEVLADKPGESPAKDPAKISEAEVVSKSSAPKLPKAKRTKSASRKKRRK